MRKMIYIILVGLFLSFASYAATKIWILKGDFANLRIGPSTSSQKIGEVWKKDNTEFLGVGQKGDWIKVKLKDVDIPKSDLSYYRKIHADVQEIGKDGENIVVNVIGWIRKDNLYAKTQTSKVVQRKGSNQPATYTNLKDIIIDQDDAAGKIARMELGLLEVEGGKSTAMGAYHISGYGVASFADNTAGAYFAYLTYTKSQKDKIKKLESSHIYDVKFIIDKVDGGIVIGELLGVNHVWGEKIL